MPRPLYGQLIADLAETNFSAVGRQYGVSGNAVRKWVRWYEAQRERGTDSGGTGWASAADVESGIEPDPDRPRETA